MQLVLEQRAFTMGVSAWQGQGALSLPRKHAHAVGHDGDPVQGGLPVEEHHVSLAQVPVHHIPHAQLPGSPCAVCKLEHDPVVPWVCDEVCTRPLKGTCMHARPVPGQATVM